MFRVPKSALRASASFSSVLTSDIGYIVKEAGSELCSGLDCAGQAQVAGEIVHDKTLPILKLGCWPV